MDQKFEDLLPYQCPSEDFGGSDYYAMEYWPYELTIPEENVLFDPIPLMEIADPYHISGIEPISTVQDDLFYDMKHGLALWNEINYVAFGSDERLSLSCKNGESENELLELGKEGHESDERHLRNAIEILKKEKKGMEEKPNMEIDYNTKRLRQACFKANFKRRKLSRGLR